MFNSFHFEGIKHFNMHDYAEARNFFLLAISKNPEVPESYFLLGQSCFLCDEKQEAIPHLNAGNNPMILSLCLRLARE